PRAGSPGHNAPPFDPARRELRPEPGRPIGPLEPRAGGDMTPSRSLALRSSPLLAALCLALAASPVRGQEAGGPSLEALEAAFGADGTVVLPHGALLRLLDPRPTARPPEPEAPREFVLLGATLRCDVGEDSARLEALLDVDVRGG